MRAKRHFGLSRNGGHIVDKSLLQLKLGFAGLLGIVFSILFSDSDNLASFSRVFSINMLVITFATILLLIDEMWGSIKEHVGNVMKRIRSVILHNIRHTVAVKEKENPSLLHYGVEAEELLDEESKLFQEMKLGTPIEGIIKKLEPEIPWKRHIGIWATLVLMVPLLFLAEILGLLN